MKKRFRVFDVPYAGSDYTARVEGAMNDLYAEGFTFVATLGSAIIMENPNVTDDALRQQQQSSRAQRAQGEQ